ncbi:response regulator, partial [Pirellulales bacterium]|nr:response regulator [Pirellulales bacterium]
LGLSISKRFCEALGGDLSVASEMGRGSVFTAVIETGPLGDVEMINAIDFQAKTPEADGRLRDLKLPPCRILVADDGDANRRLMNLVLGRAGAIVELAENGQIALEKAAAVEFDVILMDMQMPVLDGAAATERLREAGFTRPIIALTADAMKGSEEKCRAAGCSGFLTKPVDMDLLIDTLAEELADCPTSNLAVASDAGEMDVVAEVLSPITQMTRELRYAGRTRDQNSALAAGAALPRAEQTTRMTPAVPNSDTAPLRSKLPTKDPEIQAIVAGWVDRLSEQMDAIRAAVEREDHQELASLAHWLKGSAGTVGFAEFTGPAKALQQAAQAKNTDAYELLVAKISDLAERIASPTA